jgi:uncharacterized protein (DUF1330 family)
MDPKEMAAEVINDLSATVPDGQPVVMVNLLRYRDQADYPPGTEKESVTGRQAYERYSQRVLPRLRTVGARPIWRADARACLFAPKGEAWDEVVLVRYPSRSAFARMISDPGYQADAIHRTAALADSRLIATVAPQGIGWLVWQVLGLVSKFRGR